MKKPRVSIIRIVVAGRRPMSDIPHPLDYPDVYEMRRFLFGMIEREHIIHMDARELTVDEFDRMRNNAYQTAPRRNWALLLFLIGYLLASAGILVWLANHFE